MVVISLLIYNKFMFEKIKDLKVYHKMLLSFALPLLLMLIFSLISIQISLDTYDKRLYESALKELEYFVSKVDESVSDLEELSYDAAMNYDTQQLLYEALNEKNNSIANFKMRQVYLRFVQELLNHDEIMYFIYSYDIYRYDNGNLSVSIPEDILDKAIDEANRAEGRFVLLDVNSEFPYFVSARKIRHFINADLKDLGTLVFVSDIKSIISPLLDTFSKGNSSLLIMNKDDIIFSSGSILSIDENKISSNDGYSIISIEGEKYFVSSVSSPLNGWLFYSITPYDELFFTSTLTRLFLVAGFIALYVIAFFIVRHLAFAITRPVEELKASIVLVEDGSYEEALSSLGSDFSKDEIGTLKKDYAMMLDQIRVLIRDNYEKQILIKDTQYRALKAQINPHFLYNTLNSIGWMIQLKRYDEARKMITALGELLHQSFRPDKLVSVADEKALLDAYILIQKIRYSDRAEFTVNVSDEVLNFMLPQLLLQPLVENSIYHAVDESDEVCHISVVVSLKGGKLFISVSDDGPGMSKERLKEVQSYTYSGGRNGIGLKNIHSRLELLYGSDNYAMEIESKEGEGTVVTLLLPIRVKDGV